MRLAAGIVFTAISVAALAQDYPTRPIRIVTSEAGGGNDLQARRVAKGLTGALGQQVIVENRPSSVIPGDIVAKATPNGYTLSLYNNTFWIGPLLQTSPYDLERDFAAVTSSEPSPFAPGLPTVAASLPGYETIAIYGLFVPARTPPAIVNRLHRETVQVVKSADVTEKLQSAAVETVGDTPDQLLARVKADMARMKKVIDAAGISAK